MLAVLAFLSVSAAAQSSLTRDEALALAYPGGVASAERVFLEAAERAEAAQLAGAPVESSLVARYRVTCDGRQAGRAYVDTHVVRTKKESLLVSLDADGRVLRVDVTAFLEPPEYRAPDRWTDQFIRRRLDEDLAVQRSIRPLAGATLTARSVTAAVRRALAIDSVLSRRREGGR